MAAGSGPSVDPLPKGGLCWGAGGSYVVPGGVGLAITPAVAEPPLPGVTVDVLECCVGLTFPISLLTAQKLDPLSVDLSPLPPNKDLGIEPGMNPCDGPNVPREGSDIEDDSLLEEAFVFPAVWDVMTKGSGDCWDIWCSSC